MITLCERAVANALRVAIATGQLWKAFHNAENFEPDPFVDAPPTQAKLPSDLTYLYASGSHSPDRLKQLKFLLPPLPGNFHLLHQDAGSDTDRLGFDPSLPPSSAMAAGAMRSTAQFEGVAD